MKKTALISLVAGLISFNSSAEICSNSLDQAKTKVGFEAFKTFKKLGVKVNFDKTTIKTKSETAEKILDLVNGAEFEVDSTTVNSANPTRDEKLKNFFFQHGKKPLKITGKVLEIKDDFLLVEFLIGKVKKTIPLKYTLNNTDFEAKGTIDMLDFKLNSNLAKIHEACKDLHEGKTWNDVNVTVNASFVKTCK